jgi:hypothetical protein
MRSTTELQQHTIPAFPAAPLSGPGRRALLAVHPCFVKPNPDSAEALPMREDSPRLSREERLAAKLRENLRKRKEQAREKDGGQVLPKPDLNS